MDYAAAVPARVRSQLPAATNWYMADPTYGTVGCRVGGDQGDFWTTTGGQVRFETANPGIQGVSRWPITAQPSYLAPMGVIVRSNYCAPCSADKQNVGWYTPISFQQITDGSSNTLVIGEKRLQPSLYQTGDWHDDRGWTDGWDPDTLRSTHCQPARDADVYGTAATDRDALAYSFGGAHSELFNAGFADASVRSIRFDVDLETLNRLGHRSDGEQIDSEAY
jgi:hypothetical protein